MKSLVLAVASLAALAVASSADARPLWNCQSDGICPKNGPQLSGIAWPPLEAKRPAVNAVTLRSGETDLR